jgi:tRNA pseudouridine38-40 synthase
MLIEPENFPKRLALSLEYEGNRYHGWQSQKDEPLAVQTFVERALSKIANEPVKVVCSGRTDAGVHASSQVCHFETRAVRESYNWVMGANSQLPGDISLSWVREVDSRFHARFSATSRQYVYFVRCVPVRSALLRHATMFTCRSMDASRMAEAGKVLIGTHNFNAYRSVRCQAKSPVRTLTRLSIHQQDELLAIHVEANGFLQHMVRNIVGVLMEIGSGEAAINWAEQVLESKDRTHGGVNAPPHGLYFLGPSYDSDFNLTETVRIPQVLKGILKSDPVE